MPRGEGLRMMRVCLPVGCALVLAAAMAAPARAQAPLPAPEVPTTDAMWVDSVFARFATPRSPGCAVGVTRSGSLVLERDYGTADLASGTPITPDTRFYLASLAKQFTAMSIVLLAQDGKLSLDDDVRRWVPEVPDFGATITLRHLLTHTSGLRDYLTLLAVAGWASDSTLTEQQFLQLIRRQSGLNFPPGEQFLYSNTGYALLSIVVKRASGKSLGEFAADRIFGPLGMTHTDFRENHTVSVPDAARGYQLAGPAYRVSDPESDVVGDGGLYSTVEDLSRWIGNFETGIVGGRDGVELLQRAARLNGGDSIPYGFGLTIASYRGLRTISHSGAYGGFRTAMVRFPDQHLSVITLCNASDAPATLAEQVATVYLGSDMKAQDVASFDPAAPWPNGSSLRSGTEASIDARRRADELASAAGRYYSRDLQLTVTLSARDGALVLRRRGADDMRFTAVSGDLFSTRDQVLMLLRRSGDGGVSGFTLSLGRVRDLPFERQ